MIFIRRAAINALVCAAYGLGALALGDVRGSAHWFKAGAAYGALAVYCRGALLAGMPEWLLNAMPIEAVYLPVDDGDEELAN